MPDRKKVPVDHNVSRSANDKASVKPGSLPEVIGIDDLDALNAALAEMFSMTREAVGWFKNDKIQLAALVALRGQQDFLTRFKVGVVEKLDAPLSRISNALFDLADNNIDPLLQARVRPEGGRTPDPSRRQQLVGTAVASVRQLQWTGLRFPEARRLVAETLHKMGIRPSRGDGRLTERTVREWCERVAACPNDGPALRAEGFLTPDWETRIKSIPAHAGRKFVLDALIEDASELHRGTGRPSSKKPS